MNYQIFHLLSDKIDSFKTHSFERKCNTFFRIILRYLEMPVSFVNKKKLSYVSASRLLQRPVVSPSLKFQTLSIFDGKSWLYTSKHGIQESITVSKNRFPIEVNRCSLCKIRRPAFRLGRETETSRVPFLF